MLTHPIIAIIGNQGAYGRWLTRFFIEQMGLHVIGRDPSGDEVLTERELIERADVLVFSAPIRHTAALIDQYRTCANGDEHRQLWLDVTSIKREPMAAMLASAAEVVGLHPMCAPPSAPTLRGRVMVVCEARLDRWRGFVDELLVTLQAECVYTDAQQHDQRMALVQAMVHAVHLAQAVVLRRIAPDITSPADVMAFRSVSFELDMTVAARVLASNPASYEDIQFGNPAVLPVLDELLAGLTLLRDCVQAGDEAARARFREHFFIAGRQFFGQTALAEGNRGFERLGYLLADLNDRRVLDIHLLDDAPGALRQLLEIVEAAGINLRSIHSSRTASGEVHFRISCEDHTDPAALAAISLQIAASGLGRKAH